MTGPAALRCSATSRRGSRASARRRRSTAPAPTIPRRVFLTGGPGFVGGAVARQLRAIGDDVVAVVRDPSTAGPLRDIGTEIVEGDLRSIDAIREAMARCDRRTSRRQAAARAPFPDHHAEDRCEVGSERWGAHQPATQPRGDRQLIARRDLLGNERQGRGRAGIPLAAAVGGGGRRLRAGLTASTYTRPRR